MIIHMIFGDVVVRINSEILSVRLLRRHSKSGQDLMVRDYHRANKLGGGISPVERANNRLTGITVGYIVA
jgi:hypothetical protein